MKTRNLLIALLAIGILAGCGQDDSSDPEPEEATEVTEITEVTEVVDRDPAPSAPGSDLSRSEIIDIMRDQAPFYIGVSDSTISDLAESACLLWDSGGSVEEVITVGMGEGISPEVSGVLVAAAVASWCPEYAPLVDEFMATW
jgi:hypothetical protein